ncbi:site-specific tyrosine recombinase XerC [Rubripirellula lacrimiformis]|uniref:Site-specific tyrosine recombinase XerC n=1 Tax=Rubripirellula lacrimiformis TaxID=1930273 RepID=A0A517N536_9BACT|nr:tyrosine-type recombinase/integrase [Rubripirellula lacrimiformis]QDT02221.1 site-specific tyrosine recombinase XerC [Rubripirellula lacrimiformis]
MARPKAKAPARRYHLSGQSVVTIAGNDFYLGPHDSPEAIARYAVLIGTYQAGGLSLPDDFELASLEDRVAALLGHATATTSLQTGQPILVRHVTANYLEMANVRYRDSHSELHRLTQVCAALDANDGDTDAKDYGPLALQRQRKRWVESKDARSGRRYSRVYCNTLTKLIVRIWKYAVSQELVDESCWLRLRSVDPLRMGQTEAPEVADVEPVDIDVVRRTAAELSPILKAMIRIQVGTGMRPSEVCRMRPCDIDRTGEVWVYRLAKHKTANQGKTKAVPLVGDVRDAVTDYLQRAPEAPCFSPRESIAWVQSNKRANRKSKVQPSQINRAKPNPKKQPGECFTSHSYRQSIQRAAKRAGVERWHPYQIRHLAATVICDALGIEAVQAMHGHSKRAMSEHYAKRSLQRSIEAAKVAPKL